MKTVGIICEYNPFHNGHAYMLSELRGMGAETIVCLMSGNSVQRGELAVIPAAYRAAAAVSCGADAVFELPFPYSCSSAAYFALAGMRILRGLGVDTVAFGSESCDIGLLSEAASSARLPERGNKGSSGTAEDYFGSAGVNLSPNDILGAEYLKAAESIGWQPGFRLIKRVGCAHDSASGDGDFLSASAVRASYLSSGNLPSVPAAAAEYFTEAGEEGLAPVDGKRAITLITSFLRVNEPSVLSECAECGGGVANRLCSAALDYDGSVPFSSLVATKKYTDARLRRAAICAYTGVKPDDLTRRPSYVRLLAANGKGRLIAGEASGIRCVSRVSDIPQTFGAMRQKELSLRLDSLFTMCTPEMREAGFFMKMPPKIL